MRLSDVIGQLNEISKELKEVERAQKRIDKVSAQVAESYKRATNALKIIPETIKRILPDFITKRLSQFEKSLEKGLQLSQKLVDVQSKYRNSVRQTSTAWSIVKAEMEKIARSRATMTPDQLRKANIELKRSVEYAFQTERVTMRLRQEQAMIKKEFEKTKKETFEWRNLLIFGESLVKKIGYALLAVDVIAKISFGPYFKINQMLIEANSLHEERLKLVKANYAVTLLTGIGAERVAKAQAALLASGQKGLAADRYRVATIVKLAQSLGIAEEVSAKMALDADLTGNSFEKAADAMALLVDRTQLTAQEAASLASSILRVQRTLGLSSKSMPEIATSLGEMEGALKSMGGSEGMVGRLVEHFSSLKGIGDSIMFGGSQGILNPNDFRNAEKLTSMIQHTGERLRQLTGGEPLRLAAFEPLLQNLGLTMLDARALMQMSKPEEFAKIAQKIRESNTLREKTIALEDRYRQQQLETGQTLNQLKEIGITLVREALLPLATWLLTISKVIISGVLKATAYIDNLAKTSQAAAENFKTLAVVISGTAAVITGGLIIKSFAGLTAGIGAFSGAATTAAAGLASGAAILAGVAGAVATIYAAKKFYDMMKASNQEKASARNLAAWETSTRSQFGLTGHHDVVSQLKLMNQQRWASEAAASVATRTTTSSSTPYQSQIIPRPPIAQPTLATVTNTTGQSAASIDLLSSMDKSLVALKEAQIQMKKLQEQQARQDATKDELEKQQNALRNPPVSTYGNK
jgi:hypothetical protein